MIKHNIKRIIIKKNVLFFIFIMSVYYVYKAFHPATIVAVYQTENRSTVLVRNLPFTDAGKLAWWKINKKILNEQYGVPMDNSKGHFHISFWNFGDGFKEMPEHVSRWSSETTDLLCFEEMKVKKNCIDKDMEMVIFNTMAGNILIRSDGKYREEKNGDIVKAKW